ncbi:TetR/AcrR family transcriptional regulator [Enterococcus casseliflavus]|uniref:TetR/AcrR family transcriptional regulator n=1 Tax=Enterococcus casseliflavus TaxID=37734 RepID=UPI00295371B2|nr:TetR/AcrR family transcriptional regulator [Enterococcus casseliflavus]MDV7752806.1 TetR/AcrR family transcriptional regulator [Enterococcus casseliflavus]
MTHAEPMKAKDKKQQKREAIIESAKVVFSKKGLIDATMKDIIEECGISRGGIYLYFNSVDEIFLAVIEQRSQRKFDDVREMITNQVPFETILDKYFEHHRARLLHSISDSMLRAMYEFYYTHKTVESSALQEAQLTETKRTIHEIFQVGVLQGILRDEALEIIAENYMFVIEGLGILALTGHLSATTIDNQINMMRRLLPYVK